MRIMRYALAGLILFGMGLQATLSQSPPVDDPKSETKPVRQFAIEFCVAVKDNTLKAPKLIVKDGEKKSCVDFSKPTLADGKTGDRASALAERELMEGTALEATVSGEGEDKAIVDLSCEFASVCRVGVNKPGQFRGNSEKHRVIECVTLGKKTVADFGFGSLEILVQAIPESQQVATRSPSAPSR
jgi:hypothetical protein